MATLPRILEVHWRDCLHKGWQTQEEGTRRPLTDSEIYATLWWGPGNPRPKPLEADILALSGATDTEDAAAEAKRRRRDRLESDEQLELVRFLADLFTLVDQLHTTLRATGTVFSPSKPALPANWTTYRSRIAAILADAP